MFYTSYPYLQYCLRYKRSNSVMVGPGRVGPPHFFYGSIGFRGSKQTFVLLYSICLKCTVFEICNRSTSTITCTGALSPCEARLALRARNNISFRYIFVIFPKFVCFYPRLKPFTQPCALPRIHFTKCKGNIIFVRIRTFFLAFGPLKHAFCKF